MATTRAITTRVVPVALGARSYDVVVGSGLLAETGRRIAALLEAGGGVGRAAIVTDATVAQHHLATVEKSLAALGRHAGSLTLPPGEGTKSFAQLTALCEGLLDLKLERGDIVIALGGGVVGDLGGFAASILRRGVRFVQVPTSLLAQVDSSVGGKTGINTAHGKNLVGAFHQPALVLADLDTLKTLSDRQLRAGYAEVVKYGLLGDRAFFDWLESHADQVLARDPAALLHAVGHSVAMKAAIVARDETETGERALLNLGHTFGHALEAWAGYSDRLLHGEAVAIGMALAFAFSAQHGHAPTAATEAVTQHLTRAGLPVRIADIAGAETLTVDVLLRLMQQDKKVRAGAMTLILARDIGDAFIAPRIPADAIAAFLARTLA